MKKTRIKIKKKPAKKKKVTRKKPVKKIVKKRKPAKKIKKRVIKRKPVRKKIKLKRKKVVKKRKSVKIIKKRKPVRKTRQKAKPIRRARRHAKLVAGRKTRRKVKIVRRTYSGGGTLEQLFESPAKVQVMKLFFRNPESDFLLKEAARIMKTNLTMLRKETKRLEKIGLLKAKRISPRKEVFSVNPNFDFLNELKELILKASPVVKDKMIKAIRGLGKIKLVLLTGLFVGNDTARADLLIVGDNINQRKLNTFIKGLEAEAGTDINCVAMTTEEFNYRYDMYDRFVRDLIDDKCEFLINRLNI